MAPGATPAITLLRRAGVAHEVRAYDLAERRGRDRDARPDYGLDAAAALGLDPAMVGKTLIATVDGDPVAAVIPVDRQLDPRRLATARGGHRGELADPAMAERLSGSVIGGISPLALRRPVPVVVDTAVLIPDVVCVSAGRRGLQICLAPADLVRMCTAIVAPIAR